MITVTRRVFSLTATAGLLTTSLPSLPADALAEAKAALPDQWCMVYCLGEDGRRIEGMAEMAHLQWVGAEYVVTTPLQFMAPHACTVVAFEIESMLMYGEVTNHPFLFAGDWLDLRIKLNLSQAAA